LESEQHFRREGGLGDRVELRAVAQLHPHPALIRHHISPSVCKMEALMKLQQVSSCPPLLIARDGLIIDGYARWDLARRQGCPALPCVSLDISQEEALEHLLHNEVRHAGMNAYLRIELALELEPWLREKGLVNQRTGGHKKGSASLAEADRIDVRKRIAAIACASVGNVNKVKYLRSQAAPELKDALRNGRVTINRAFLWAKESTDRQCAALSEWEHESAISGVVRQVLRRHRRNSASAIDPVAVARALGDVMATAPERIPVRILPTTGRAVYVTYELAISLTGRKDFPICDSLG
jgi:hypothetical protein